MNLPSKKELTKYLDKDYKEFREDGLTEGEAISRLLEEYELLAEESDLMKLIIYTKAFQFGKTYEGVIYRRLEEEIKKLNEKLNIDPIENQDYFNKIVSR